MDCFASLAMTISRHAFAISRLDTPKVCWKFPYPPIRGRRECRAPDAPDSRVCNGSGSTRVSQVTPESPGTPRAMVYGLLRDLPGDNCATVACGNDRKLDISVKMSEPHDLAVRTSTPVSRASHVHRIPAPTSVTFAKRPL